VLQVPSLDAFQSLLEGSGDKEMSTTMAFVRLLTLLVRDKQIGQYVVPIVPDEARTFGMEGMFRQLGIYASQGQLYEPVDSDQVMYYREDKKGQILQEGINEAGAMSSWIAAATAYANHGQSMIPFYIYYSMFGFQRIGDLAWAAGDMRARGFLIGGTAGRTTLAGEGLQHQDGHSLMLASTIPNCVAYDPAYAYELAVIVQDGLRRMYQDKENVFYYITAMNENYVQPAMPEGCAEGILKGMYPVRPAENDGEPQVQLLGSGTILREVLAAAELLEQDFGIGSTVWSVTSFNELRREGHRDRALEPAPSRPDAARHLGRIPARRHARPHRRRHRLHATPGRPDPALCTAPLCDPGHRRLRAQRHAPSAPQILRGRPPSGRARRAQGARRRGNGSGVDGDGRHRQIPHRSGQAQPRERLSHPVNRF
jgi:homodimeric-type pyruvate dehydrogenase E1 component